MQAVQVQSYLARANDFLSGMKTFAEMEGQTFRYSSMLLAIHSAISYGDALWVGLGEMKTAAHDNKSREPGLKKRLNKCKYENDSGLKHLQSLLQDKTGHSLCSESRY